MTDPRRDRPELLPCVWVGAGVLSYRLCDRAYDCEGCDLFRALRGDLTPPGATADGGEPPRHDGDDIDRYCCQLLAGCTLQLDRYYSPGHLWVRPDGDDDVVVGLDGHVLRVLYPVEAVTPPRRGTWLRRHEPCGWIVRGHRSVPLPAPLSGEILQVNAGYGNALRAPPPGGAGDAWLLRVRAHEPPDAVPDLARGEDALVRYLAEVRLIKRALRAAADEGDGGAVGAALADGGVPEPDLERVLGTARFDALVEALFRVQIS